MKLKKETLIVIFYIMYFSWLFTVTYLTTDTYILNIFTTLIIFFYFTFLKEAGDIVWFAATFIGIILGKVSAIDNGRFIFQFDNINQIPIWLPVAWGTTIVALRKFFIILNVGKS